MEAGAVVREERRDEVAGSSSCEWKAVALRFALEVVYRLDRVEVQDIVIPSAAVARGAAIWRTGRPAARARPLALPLL